MAMDATDLLAYRGRRVIVTGCFSGMGQATARILLDLGAEVHGLDYKHCTLPLASFGIVDLRDPASIDAGVSRIGGTIDGLFNCAGLPQTFPPLEVMKVNFIGTRHLTERVAERMTGGGAIASIASTAGMGWSKRVDAIRELVAADGFEAALAWCTAHPDIVAEGYSFSKEALIYWTQARGVDLIGRGIRINCILPGPTETPMMAQFLEVAPEAVIDIAAQPINRRARPEEQAAPLVFLGSPMASYLNGVALAVDGGFTGGLACGLIDSSVMTRPAER